MHCKDHVKIIQHIWQEVEHFKVSSLLNYLKKYV